MRVTFLDFSCTFISIQHMFLRNKWTEMEAERQLVVWTTDYLNDRPLYERLEDFWSVTVVRSTGAPKGIALHLVLFTLYMSGFRYTQLCHV